MHLWRLWTACVKVNKMETCSLSWKSLLWQKIYFLLQSPDTRDSFHKCQINFYWEQLGTTNQNQEFYSTIVQTCLCNKLWLTPFASPPLRNILDLCMQDKKWYAKPKNMLIKVMGWTQESPYDDSSRSSVHKLSSYLPAPPALKLSVNETHVVDPGQDVTMSCEVTAGFPMPTVTWARYPGPLPRRATVRGGSLTLRSVSPAESGFYNCTAVNNVGNPARRNVNLIVRSMYTVLLIFVLYTQCICCSRFPNVSKAWKGYQIFVVG